MVDRIPFKLGMINITLWFGLALHSSLVQVKGVVQKCAICRLPALSAIHHSILLYDDMREWVEAKSELQQEHNFRSLTLERECALKDVLRHVEELSI
ncbi:hypothetical protein ACS0TY_030243 [Phlomoides rotata]